MNRETIDILNRLNEGFYQANHESFDRSRQMAWPGWKRVASHFEQAKSEGPFHLLDVACGNMRFEKFLQGLMPSIDLQATCLDSCDSLAVSVDGCVYRHVDVIDELVEVVKIGEADEAVEVAEIGEFVGVAEIAEIAEIAEAGEIDELVEHSEIDELVEVVKGGDSAEISNAAKVLAGSDLANSETPFTQLRDGYDAVVSFGFFHHVPSHALRARLLEVLVESARPDGFVALSLWRFASDEKMRTKAQRTTQEAAVVLSLPHDLEQGDYVLGWNDEPGAYRYCHSFDDAEIEELVDSIAPRAALIDRFRSDGRANAMNEYLVFRRRSDDDRA